MALRTIPFKPGIYEEASDRDVGRMLYWKDCDKVRFRDGLPEKLGGWADTVFADEPDYVGAARGVVDWRRTNGSAAYIGFGTSAKLYLADVGAAQIYDITPQVTSINLTDPFTTTNTSAVVTVTDTSHGQVDGATVDFSGATAVGGITIDGEYTITVVDANSYTITHSAPATSSAVGGGTVATVYEIPSGPDSGGVGIGYGALTYGSSTYGTARTSGGSGTGSDIVARVWSLDNFGEILIACPINGALYQWAPASGTSTRATVISQASDTNILAFVSSEDRHVVLLGTKDSLGNFDSLLIRWCSQEDYTDWTPTITNTAGDKRLDNGTEIVAYCKVRGATLIFTNTYVYSMQFVGPPYTFSFSPLGDNGGIRGMHAAAAYEGIAYWMGGEEFYYYDGSVHVLPCTVKRKVFEDLNENAGTVFASANRLHNEIWWYYPSAGSTDNDRYVVYNVKDKAWYYGALPRTAFVGASDTFGVPYGFYNGRIYQHEYGTSDNGAAMTAYVESGDIEIDPDGNDLQHLSKYIPDFKELSGEVTVTFSGKKYPQATETFSSSHDINAQTQFVNPRMRVRQMSVKIESDGVSDDWRASSLRFDVIPHGKR